MPGPWSRVWDVECQGSARSRVPGQGERLEPGMAWLPWGIQFPGGIKAGQAQPQQEPSSLSCHSSWNCSQGAAGAAGEPGPGAAPGAALPLPSPRAPQPQRLGHSSIATASSCLGKPLLKQLWVIGEQSSGSSLSFRMPSTDLIAWEQGFSRTPTHQRERFQP